MKRSLFAQIVIVACLATVVDAQFPGFDPFGALITLVQEVTNVVLVTTENIVNSVQDVILFPLTTVFTIAVNTLLATLNTQVNEQVVPLIPDPLEIPGLNLFKVRTSNNGVCGSGPVRGQYKSVSLEGQSGASLLSLSVSNLYPRPVTLQFYGDFSFLAGVPTLTGTFEIDLSGEGCTSTTGTGTFAWTDLSASGTAYAFIQGDPLGTNLCLQEFSMKELAAGNYNPVVTFDSASLGDFSGAEAELITVTNDAITNAYNTYAGDFDTFEAAAAPYLPVCLQDLLALIPSAQ